MKILFLSVIITIAVFLTGAMVGNYIANKLKKII